MALAAVSLVMAPAPRSEAVGRGVKEVFWCSAGVAGLGAWVCEGVVEVAVAPAAAEGGPSVGKPPDGMGGGGGTSSRGLLVDFVLGGN